MIHFTFFNLLNFTRKTSWHLEIFVLRKKYDSFLHSTFVFPYCEQNWMKYDSTSREIIRYHIFYRSLTNLVFPRILRKTFGGTSSIPILHHVLSKTRKNREIETFSWTNKRIFKYVYLRFFLMKLSKLIETRFWSDYPRKLTRRSEKHHTNFREKAEGYKILWVSTWANRTIT